MPITATHNGRPSSRKPDIILVSFQGARNAFSEGDLGSWDDYAFETAAHKPKNNFKWKDSFSAVELERTKHELPLPKEKYSLKPAKTLPPQPLPSSLNEMLLPMAQSALYAAERMSHAFWISHAINLVIIGESSRTVVVSFHMHVLT